jgi:hypothetical protein
MDRVQLYTSYVTPMGNHPNNGVILSLGFTQVASVETVPDQYMAALMQTYERSTGNLRLVHTLPPLVEARNQLNRVYRVYRGCILTIDPIVRKRGDVLALAKYFWPAAAALVTAAADAAAAAASLRGGGHR